MSDTPAPPPGASAGFGGATSAAAEAMGVGPADLPAPPRGPDPVALDTADDAINQAHAALGEWSTARLNMSTVYDPADPAMAAVVGAEAHLAAVLRDAAMASGGIRKLGVETAMGPLAVEELWSAARHKTARPIEGELRQVLGDLEGALLAAAIPKPRTELAEQLARQAVEAIIGAYGNGSSAALIDLVEDDPSAASTLLGPWGRATLERHELGDPLVTDGVRDAALTAVQRSPAPEMLRHARAAAALAQVGHLYSAAGMAALAMHSVHEHTLTAFGETPAGAVLRAMGR